MESLVPAADINLSWLSDSHPSLEILVRICHRINQQSEHCQWHRRMPTKSQVKISVININKHGVPMTALISYRGVSRSKQFNFLSIDLCSRKIAVSALHQSLVCRALSGSILNIVCKPFNFRKEGELVLVTSFWRWILDYKRTSAFNQSHLTRVTTVLGCWLSLYCHGIVQRADSFWYSLCLLNLPRCVENFLHWIVKQLNIQLRRV